MIKEIVLVDRVDNGDDSITVIAECNVYDENGKVIQQLSRSPFRFSNTDSDQEIIDFIRSSYYAKYL